MDDKICGDLERKVVQLDQAADMMMSQTGNQFQSSTLEEDPTSQLDEIIGMRIQQLSFSKVLVNIHRKSAFLLVTAFQRFSSSDTHIWTTPALNRPSST